MTTDYQIGKKTNQVPKFWIDKYEKEASKYWDKFYKSNTTNFFKDRHWIFRQFPELYPAFDGWKFASEGEEPKNFDLPELPESPVVRLMEVGCGVGNTIYPLLEGCPHLFTYAFDFAPTAVKLVKENINYKEGRCKAFVCDVTSEEIPDMVEDESLDFITMFFVLSAIAPEKMVDSLKRLRRTLKSGGKILFRDYAVGDMAQLRFEAPRKDKEANRLSENFYVRKDGTRAYYFELEELQKLFKEAGYEIEENVVVERYVENPEIQRTHSNLDFECVSETLLEGRSAASPSSPNLFQNLRLLTYSNPIGDSNSPFSGSVWVAPKQKPKKTEKAGTVTTSTKSVEDVIQRTVNDPNVNESDDRMRRFIVSQLEVIEDCTIIRLSSSRWVPTSLREMEATERELLSKCGVDFEQSLVKINTSTDEVAYVNTVKVGSGPPLLLVHGFAAGIGLWVGNLAELSKHNTIYAIDLVGFGRSTRHPFRGKSPEEAENYFLDMIEGWRLASGLEGKINLLGHSFGGYLVGAYALKYPQHIDHLILADPWGLPPSPDASQQKYSLQWTIAKTIINNFTPLATVRGAGPYGPGLVAKFRADLPLKFWHLHETDVVTRYIYHINAQEPEGERAFALLSKNLVYPALPLRDRLLHLQRDIPIAFIYGDHTWMDAGTGQRVAEALGDRAEFHLIENSGHHCYIDNYDMFNEKTLVLLHDICTQGVFSDQSVCLVKR
ncbi:abhydrolase domain containing 4 [Planoprotostelium fungivorum]|uniref:Abhydrolase domain containing 4 n=1 Tax=Planoprotostelium fungivorum TaxID=1890364 RepID=A0A2P6NDF2_9EUKA|nr:abhydrolase domain containing 4 [Planoprotostelium fungivorum]